MPAFQPILALQGRQILIVEDEILIAMELEGLLRGKGCTIIGPAPSAKLALALLDRAKPDAAVLDLNLNGEPSRVVAEALVDKKIPFVIVSGYTGAQINEPLLQQAPRLSKPVDQLRLLRELTDLLP